MKSCVSKIVIQQQIQKQMLCVMKKLLFQKQNK